MSSRGLALITGASSGIGAALARRFAQQDFDLVLTARRKSNLDSLAGSLPGEINTTVVSCDLTSSEDRARLLQTLSDRRLEPDILVNNAGVALTGEFHELPPREIHDLVLLNVLALTALTREFLPGMIARGSGRILNVASVAAFQPVPLMNVYAASKSFVLSLTESLSEELKGTGVSVTALCPGLTRTEMVESLHAGSVPPFLMSSVEDVAREGFEAVMSREVIRIPGIANQAAVTWAQFQPRWLVRNLGGLISRFRPVNPPS